MAAVRPLVARCVFVLYISFALLGAILIGYVYKITGGYIRIEAKSTHADRRHAGYIQKA